MALYLNLVASFLKRNTKIWHKKFNLVCFKQQKSPIYTLKYYGVHIHVHLFQKVN